MATHDSTLKLRLSEELRQRIQQKAEERGVSVSEFIREAVETAIAGGVNAELFEAYTTVGGMSVPVRTILHDVTIRFKDAIPTEDQK